MASCPVKGKGLFTPWWSTLRQWQDTCWTCCQQGRNWCPLLYGAGGSEGVWGGFTERERVREGEGGRGEERERERERERESILTACSRFCRVRREEKSPPPPSIPSTSLFPHTFLFLDMLGNYLNSKLIVQVRYMYILFFVCFDNIHVLTNVKKSFGNHWVF